MDKKNISNRIKELALQIGFDDCGIAEARLLKKDARLLQDWLDKEYNADMKYMGNHFDKRTDPRLLVENAKSVIVVLLNYYPQKLQSKELPQIAKYAYGKDYHKIIKDKLFLLFEDIKKLLPEQTISGRVFTDSAPVLERKWGYEAGLGRIGKNTMLIHPKLGSFCFIGEIILDLELAYDQPVKYGCGTCTKCIQACPTGALKESHILDARKCISYHTIENKGEIPEEVSYNQNNNLFGCDICLNACPGNINIQSTHEEGFAPTEGLLEMTKQDWLALSEEEFNTRFKDSPILRAGYKKIIQTARKLKD